MEAASKLTRVRAQCVALLSCMLSVVSAGNVVGWLSPAFYKLRYATGSMPVDQQQFMWVSSMSFIGVLIGPIVFALIVDRCGRKWINFITSIIYIIGWGSSILASNMGHIIASRIILGAAVGFTLCIAPVYGGEVIENHLRGAFSAALVPLCLIGFLYVYTLAPFIDFKILSIIPLVFPLVSLLSFALMPESPHFHIMKNNLRKAEANLMRLRGESNRIHIIEEFSAMVEYLEDGFSRESLSKKFKLMRLKKAKYQLLLITALVFIQCFSGIFPLMGDIHVIITEADSMFNDYLGVIIATALGFIVSLATLFFIDRIGRKTLILISSVGCSMSTSLIGTYFALKDYQVDGEEYLLMSGVFSLQFFFYAGLACVPYTVGCEIFPAFVRPWTTAFIVMLLSLFTFLANKTYHLLGSNFGFHVPYLLFCGILLLGSIIAFLYMPETKQKSLAEIQEYFLPKKTLDERDHNKERRVTIHNIIVDVDGGHEGHI